MSATIRDGLLLVDKPAGISSAKAVAIVKRRLGGVKVGHLGTLDPFASGLLPLCLGQGTKLAPYLNTADKGYEGVVRLGIRTDTLDMTGEVLSTTPVPAIGEPDLVALGARFVGEIDQVPPAFSAIKKEGVRMYELARRGQAPELAPRRVFIERLVLRPLGTERIALSMDCSKGTYVRSVARDLGELIGCGGVLEQLVRTGFGRFALADAVALDDVPESPGEAELGRAYLSPGRALEHLRRFEVGPGPAASLRQGRQAALGTLAAPDRAGERACVVGPDGGLVAVVGEAAGRWQLERVFDGDASCAA